jgi:hypothetical protein
MQFAGDGISEADRGVKDEKPDLRQIRRYGRIRERLLW